jgi:hypothetical protein
MLNIINNTAINNLLSSLLQKVQDILQEQFIGMYIGGSIANNSFNSAISDIDCYIVTSDVLSERLIHNIEEMHKQIYTSKLPFANKIEASYLPHDIFLNFDPNDTRPYFNEGNFYMGE